VRRIVIPAVIAALAAAAPAHAGRFIFGSDLSAPADSTMSGPAGTIYWNSAIGQQRPGPPAEPGDHERLRRFVAAAPADGQLRYVTIHGGAVPGGGAGDFRFVVLHPQPGGGVAVEQTDDRVNRVIETGDPNHRTGQKGFDWKLCLHRGDFLGIRMESAATLRTFASIPGSAVSTTDGTVADRELLMEVYMETGADAFDRCPGGYENHVFRGLDLRDPDASYRRRERAVVVQVRCPRYAYGGCFGRVALTTRAAGRTITLGRRAISFRSGEAGALRVPLSAAGAALVERRGSLTMTLAGSGHDDPSDARNRTAPGHRPGRQSARFAHKLNLTVR
jgi:hypothetical protein